MHRPVLIHRDRVRVYHDWASPGPGIPLVLIPVIKKIPSNLAVYYYRLRDIGRTGVNAEGYVRELFVNSMPNLRHDCSVIVAS